MRQFNVLAGTRGWVWLYERTIRWKRMRNEPEVRRRTEVLDFWKKHGTEATSDAFHVLKRTLFRWRAALDLGRGRLEALDPKSTAPERQRKRRVLPEVEAFIIRERTEHPRLGKKKLVVLLRGDGYAVSESTVGRIIHDLKKCGLLSRHRKLCFQARTGRHTETPQVRRPKLRRQVKRGMELDTIPPGR